MMRFLWHANGKLNVPHHITSHHITMNTSIVKKMKVGMRIDVVICTIQLNHIDKLNAQASLPSNYRKMRK